MRYPAFLFCCVLALPLFTVLKRRKSMILVGLAPVEITCGGVIDASGAASRDFGSAHPSQGAESFCEWSRELWLANVLYVLVQSAQLLGGGRCLNQTRIRR
ncbi:hypothetical protein B0H17DRAFT_1092179 [Mycena rosella]|uniref:Secreted protein n=1 Tax=Mycena rosella TaxID=1033263 RepID=A0AAD7CUA1_MYCRO|nr:hypothetical protein B0H17DRAFT_1092179 [Mycena rosella]